MNVPVGNMGGENVDLAWEFELGGGAAGRG